MFSEEDSEYMNQPWPWYSKLGHWILCTTGFHFLEEEEMILHGRAFCLHCKQWIVKN